MNDSDVYVFTHSDLDGVVSYLALCWAYKKKLNVIPTTPLKLEQDIETFLTKKAPTYKKLYFLDLDVSKIGSKIDNKNVTIIDHHKSNLFSFQHATTFIKNESSCAKLLYESFLKTQAKPINNNQKLLIALADDYDSNKKSIKLSSQLNIVYHSMQNKFASFVEDYYNGFRCFDKFKLNTIALYDKHCSEYMSTLSPYIGIVDFEGVKNIKVGSVFCDKFVQECCDWLFLKYKCDIAIAVLMNQKRISVRRNTNVSNVDVSRFTQRIANGGGHEAAAGGTLTDEFVEFTKMLKPIL